MPEQLATEQVANNLPNTEEVSASVETSKAPEPSTTPTFDDFISRKSDTHKETPKAKQEVPKIETPPKEEAKVEEQIEEPKPKVELPDFQPFNDVPPEKPAPTKRELANKDFTGISESDLPRFTELARRMSVEGFAELKKQYLTAQELQSKVTEYEASKPKEGEIPPSYYSHPEAYRLSPEYNNLEYVTGIADKLVNHWQEQYERVQLGEPWINVTVDQKTGELSYSEPQQVAPEQKARLAAQMMRQVTQSTMQANQLNQQKNQLVQSYQSKIGEAQASVQQIREKFFKGWDDKNHITAPLQKKYMEQVHPAHRDNPYAQLFVNGKIMYDAALAKIKELETQLKGKQINAQIPAQPKKDETIVPAATGKNGIPTYEDFLKRKMQTA